MIARLVRTLLLLVFAAFFVVPLVSLLNFSTKDVFTGERTGAAWRALVEDPTMSEAIRTSLTLAALTVVGMVVLLVPTMIWVRLRVPRATRLVEFLCLLPLTIPALVIVVGVKNVYAWVDYFFGDTPLTLRFNVDNVADKRYWATAYNAFSAFGARLLQGGPRTFKLSASVEF